MPVIAKHIHLETNAKPARLSYLYLYRMYKFNRMKEKLDRQNTKISSTELKHTSRPLRIGLDEVYETPKSNYYLQRLVRLKSKKERLEKEIKELSAKLDNQEKLSSFVQKQVETNELGFWKSTLRDMKGIVISTFASMSGAIGMFAVASIAVESITPGFLQGASPAHAVAVLAIFALSVAAGVRLYGLAENARHVLDIGKEKAEKLVSNVLKLAA